MYVTIGCYQGDYSSWDNIELDDDVTIGCYYGDYSSCDNTIPTSRCIWTIFFPHTCLPPFLIIKVTAHYCIASLIIFLNFRLVCRVLVCTIL